MKKNISILLVMLLIVFMFISCSNKNSVSTAVYEDVQTQLTTKTQENEDLVKQLETLRSDYDSLNDKFLSNENTLAEYKTKCEEYEAVIAPYKELSDAEIELKTKETQAELEKLAKEEAEKIAKEEAEKEAKEKKGYNTGITYNQLARTPDDYMSEKVKFTGEVIQVIEGSSKTQLRIAVNSDYDRIIFVEYNSSIVKSRVLEDDIITIYGVSQGLLSYESTMGGTITIPAVKVDKIDQ